MSTRTSDRLRRQLGFVRLADRLKTVLRRSRIMSGGRLENSAEHSWHLALMVLALNEHARTRVNVSRAMQLALVHDLPEILVGDSNVYDVRARARKAKTEPRAAARVFGKLPRGQARYFLRLWKEYEACKTPEAKFVRVVDRLEPQMCNFANRGYSWKKHGTSARQVNGLNATWKQDAPALGVFADQLIRRAVRRDYLKK